MKWLITGGAGFIGSHTAARLLSRGHEVVVLDDLSRRGSDANLRWLRDEAGLEVFHQVSVRDREALDAVVREHADADAVLHLAAQVAVTTSVLDPRADFETNAMGTHNVLEAVRRAAGGRPAVLYSSTNKVYGALDHLEIVEEPTRVRVAGRPRGIDETERLDFHSPYGCSKGAGDQCVVDYARIYGMRTVVFRQSCIYGTRQFGVEDQGWVAWFCIAAMLGKPISIYGDGKQVRDLLWIEDLVDLYERSLAGIDKVAGRALNVGGGAANTLSLLELMTWLDDALGRKVEWTRRPTRPGDQRAFIADTGLAERLLGWKPKVPVRQGLVELLEWVRSHRDLLGS
jgi:CDP-paratose 2-epimerase